MKLHIIIFAASVAFAWVAWIVLLGGVASVTSELKDNEDSAASSLLGSSDSDSDSLFGGLGGLAGIDSVRFTLPASVLHTPSQHAALFVLLSFALAKAK